MVMNDHTAIVLAALALFALFVWWYGGAGKPMDAAEQAQLMQALGQRLKGTQGESLLNEARELLASEDGKEFVMHNCVRYRAKALYPPGSPYGDDPREAGEVLRGFLFGGIGALGFLGGLVYVSLVS